MVTHESYRSADGRWLYPDEVVRGEDGAVEVGTGAKVTVGRSEAMSKSRRNTVDPGAIIARYGADTARWFVLSDNPPERDVEWTEAGVAGASRFVQRCWRAAELLARTGTTGAAAAAGPSPTAPAPSGALIAGAAPSGALVAGLAPSGGSAALALRRETHRAIAAVTAALESFSFNVAVARCYTLVNAIQLAEREPGADMAFARREAVETLARLLSPMAPHLAEEMHALLRPNDGLVAEMAWPAADQALVAVATAVIAVQVMGKLRATIEVAAGAGEAEVLSAAEAEPNVARALQGRRVAKRIHIPGRIVNFVLAP